MNIREFLIDALKNDRWNTITYDNYFDVALKYYLKTGEKLFPDDYCNNKNKKYFDYSYHYQWSDHMQKIREKYRVEDLPLEFIIMSEKNGCFCLFDYYVISQKVKDTKVGELYQDSRLWSVLISKSNNCVCDDYENLFNSILEKGYGGLFLTSIFKRDDEFNLFNDYVKNNIGKIAASIRMGVRLKKEDVLPNEFLYDDEILEALVDTGQIDFIRECNTIYDNLKYDTKKVRFLRLNKLHSFVPRIIEYLESDSLLYENLDLSRLEGFFSQEDYELIEKKYLEYKKRLSARKFIPDASNLNKEDKDLKQKILSYLEEGLITEDGLLEVIIEYRTNKNKKAKKKVKK